MSRQGNEGGRVGTYEVEPSNGSLEAGLSDVGREVHSGDGDLKGDEGEEKGGQREARYVRGKRKRERRGGLTPGVLKLAGAVKVAGWGRRRMVYLDRGEATGVSLILF